MTHAANNDQPAGPASARVVSGGGFASENEAREWVRKLDQMHNDQLADVLGFIFCKLCKR